MANQNEATEVFDKKDKTPAAILLDSGLLLQWVLASTCNEEQNLRERIEYGLKRSFVTGRSTADKLSAARYLRSKSGELNQPLPLTDAWRPRNLTLAEWEAEYGPKLRNPNLLKGADQLSNPLTKTQLYL